MATGSIIKNFDVVKDISASQFSGFIDAFANPFFFQAAKEGFCNGIECPNNFRDGSCWVQDCLPSRSAASRRCHTDCLDRNEPGHGSSVCAATPP
jgi:hypothetical protein